jgi:hypothetical protein
MWYLSTQTGLFENQNQNQQQFDQHQQEKQEKDQQKQESDHLLLHHPLFDKIHHLIFELENLFDLSILSSLTEKFQLKIEEDKKKNEKEETKIKNPSSSSSVSVQPSLPRSGKWIKGPSIPFKTSHFAFGEINGSIYLAGGTFDQKELFSFNPITNQWSKAGDLSDLPTSICFMGSCTVGDRLYSIGGEAPGEYYSKKCWSYDRSSNSWIRIPDMPTGRQNLSCSSVDGVIYAIGGWNGNYLNKNEGFDIGSNKWSTKSPMISPRSDLTTAVVDGIIYSLGGLKESSVLSNNEAYDPKILI